MTDWNDDSKWAKNVDLIARFIRGMLDKARSIEPANSLRKSNPRAAAKALLEGMQESVERFEPVADLQEAAQASDRVSRETFSKRLISTPA